MPRTRRPARLLLDALEPRTLLSVSAATLAGPQTAGITYTFRELVNNQTVGSFTRTIAGQTTFNTHPVTEIDETDSPSSGSSSFVQRFNAFDSNLDYISYGSITNNTTTTINNPAAILFPTGIAAGSTSTNSYTAISSSLGGNSSIQITDVSTLVAQSNGNPEATFSLTTPGGIFQVYEVDEARTITNGTTTTVNFRHFISPTYGEVEFAEAVGNGTPEIFQLTNLTGLGNITPAPVASQLAFVQQPSNAIAGAAISPAITVNVEDASGNIVTTDNSTVTLSLASGNGTLGGTVTAQALNGVATFSNLTLSTAGTYTLKATDSTLTAATSTSFTIAALQPLTVAITSSTLPDTVVAGSKTKATVTLSITNPNATPITGKFTLALDAQENFGPLPPGIARSFLAFVSTPVGTVTKKLTIKANSSSPFTFKIKTIPPGLLGDQSLSATVTDPAGNSSFSSQSFAFTAVAPTVTLLPSAPSLVTAKNGSATLSFTLTNTGNSRATGPTTFALVTATDNALTSPTTVYTKSLKFNLTNTKTKKIKLKLTASQLTALNAAPFSALQVTASTGTTQTLLLTTTT